MFDWGAIAGTVLGLLGGNDAGRQQDFWNRFSQERWADILPLLRQRGDEFQNALAGNRMVLERLRQDMFRDPASDPRFSRQYTAGTQAGDASLDRYGGMLHQRLAGMGADPSAIASADAQLAAARARAHAQAASAREAGIYNERLARQGRFQAANAGLFGLDPSSAYLGAMGTGLGQAQNFGAQSNQWAAGLGNLIGNIYQPPDPWEQWMRRNGGGYGGYSPTTNSTPWNQE